MEHLRYRLITLHFPQLTCLRPAAVVALCSRLQGFPDDFLQSAPYCSWPDGVLPVMGFFSCNLGIPTKPDMIMQVVVADDHPAVRHGLKAVLESEGFCVLAEATNGPEVLHLAATIRPDVFVLDINMPGPNGLETARKLTAVLPHAKLIALTQHNDDQLVVAALNAGFRGYVLKSQAARDLIEAIHQVCRGAVYLSPGISRAVVEAYLTKDRLLPDPLTSRERQVLQLIAEGKSSKEIAETLGISPKTVETHRGKLMQKLDIHEVASLVRYAVRRGLLSA